MTAPGTPGEPATPPRRWSRRSPRPPKRHRASIAAPLTALVVGLGAASADEPRPQIVITGDSGTHTAFEVAYDAFRASVRDWADVRDLRRSPASDGSSPSAAAGPPRLVYALGAKGLERARREFPDVPRVFALAEGEDCDLAPRRDETGVVLRLIADDLVQALVRASPKVHRVGYLGSSTTNLCGPRELDQALRRHRLEPVGETVSSVREGLQALRRIRGTVDAIVLLPNPDVISDETVEYAVAAGLERRIPVVGFSPRIAASGALLAVSLDPAAIASQAADLARRALGGTIPRPELPRSQRLTINSRTARLLGLELPEDLRERALRDGGEP